MINQCFFGRFQSKFPSKSVIPSPKSTARVFLNRCHGRSARGTEEESSAAAAVASVAAALEVVDLADKKCHLSRKKYKIFINLGHLTILALFIICN